MDANKNEVTDAKSFTKKKKLSIYYCPFYRRKNKKITKKG